MLQFESARLPTPLTHQRPALPLPQMLVEIDALAVVE